MGFAIGGAVETSQTDDFRTDFLKNEIKDSPSLSDTVYVCNCGSGPEDGHETALELVSGADWVLSAPLFEPDPLERVSGPSSAGNRPNTK